MASILSGKFSKVDAKAPKGAAEGKEGEDAETQQQKKGRASRLNPLLNSRTADYVDDLDLYVPRISRAERYQYWQQLTKNTRPRRLPTHFRSWVQKQVDAVNERDAFPTSSLRFFGAVKSSFWDQLYLNLFILWWLLIVFYGDGWASKVAPMAMSLNKNNAILLLPPVLMFASQLLPLVGTLYSINYCNDMVRFLATSEITSWGFVCALTAQYVEYFFYSGQGKGHRAGNCRKGSPRKAAFSFFARRLQRSAVVSPMDGDSGGNDDSVSAGGEHTSIDVEGGGGQVDQAAGSTIPGARTPLGGGGSIPELDEKESDDDEEEKEEEEEGADEGGGDSQSADQLVPMTEWTCIVCRTENRSPSTVPSGVDICFGEKGVFYKRAYAKITFAPPKPACSKCSTFFDYQPPRGSAHLFPHNPKPHVAFENYPLSTEVQAGLKIDRLSRLQYRLQSFLSGIQNVPSSLMQPNDWRLRRYASDKFPELPRYILSTDELYQLGEVVECKQQKLDWSRARVIKVHVNRTYDIRYDTMDEIRFVLHRALRTVPEKRAYAFRVELSMVAIAVLSPLGAALGVLTGNFGFLFVGALVASTALFCIRMVTFFQYLNNYYNAGCNVIARLSSMYIFPLLFIMIASIVAVIGGRSPSSWPVVAALFIVGLLTSIPVLYTMRPTFALIGAALFFQVGLGLVLVAGHVSQSVQFAYIAIPLSPFLTTALALKLLRRHLHTAWDVSLIMHPARDTSVDNPSILHVAWDALLDCFDG